MSILRYAQSRVALFALALVFAAPAIAQDGMRSPLQRAVSKAYAQELATQPLPQGFQAPDRSLPEYQSVQATFTVTTAADSGPGSLREAMDAANASPGLDAIAFDINGGGSYEEIEVLSLLPYLTDPVTIDGDTQGCDVSAGLCIRLDGPTLVNDPVLFDGGLVVFGGGSTVHGLLFTRFFSFPALQIRSGANTVTGCYFGTDRTGMITDPDGTPNSGDELGNGTGIVVGNEPDLGSPAVNNTIGGATAAERNVVAGSVGTGILLLTPEATGNTVRGNYVGTNATGTAALGNAYGIDVREGVENTVQDNLVSGNRFDGISVEIGASSNLITGNFVGTDVTGTSAIPNGTPAGTATFSGWGILVREGSNNLIENNLASGNAFAGIAVIGFAGDGVTDNVVRGNLAGTDVTGTLPIPNGSVGLSSTGFGIVLATDFLTTTRNTIGGASFADANVVGFNLTAGVALDGTTVRGNVIDHNYIGVTPDGAPIPNGLYGVFFRNLFGGPSGNRVGSLTATSPPSGNVIGYQPIGIALSETTLDDEVAFNQFVGAPGAFLPIDLRLDGPTANDAEDLDDGPNRLQNSPVIESASASGDQLTVTFLVDTTPSNGVFPLTVRFFRRSVDGGVERYVGLGEVEYAESDAQQSVTATVTLPAPLPPGEMREIVATATDADGSTGEMSPVGVVVASEPVAGVPGTHALSAAYPNPFDASAQFTLAVAESQHVVIEVYDTLGRRVAVLLDELVPGGTTRSVRIDGQRLASGSYVVRVAGEQFQDRLRVTVLK